MILFIIPLKLDLGVRRLASFFHRLPDAKQTKRHIFVLPKIPRSGSFRQKKVAHRQPIIGYK